MNGGTKFGLLLRRYCVTASAESASRQRSHVPVRNTAADSLPEVPRDNKEHQNARGLPLRTVLHWWEQGIRHKELTIRIVEIHWNPSKQKVGEIQRKLQLEAEVHWNQQSLRGAGVHQVAKHIEVKIMYRLMEIRSLWECNRNCGQTVMSQEEVHLSRGIREYLEQVQFIEVAGRQ
jgi:hypothetical protein